MPATKTRKNSSNKAVKESVYEIVTRRILDALDSGTIPWRNPVVFGGTMPTNLKSKKAYRGINVFLLSIESMVSGYTSPYWLSYKQAQELAGTHTNDNGFPVWEVAPLPEIWNEDGTAIEQFATPGVQATNEAGDKLFHGGVRKGEKSTLITFWKRLKVTDKVTGDDKIIPMLRYYRVFNVEQCDGLDERIPADDNPNGFTPDEVCESIMDGYKDGPEICEGAYFGNGAGAYAPLQDKILMPLRTRFDNETNFYKVLFHEGIHSTGHGNRLNRDGWENCNSNTDEYSEEELVAELGAAFLCGIAGIDSDQVIEDSAGYIDGWRKKLSNDPKIVVKAAGKAQKAADRILGTTFEETTESEDTDA